MQPEPHAPSQGFIPAPPLQPPRRGAIVWVTGLAATGKSRLAAALSVRLEAVCRVEVLDGDEVRLHLSRRADSSREERSAVLARVGFVARLLARHGVIVIAPSVAFDAATRVELRRAAEGDGLGFVEVFLEADLDALIEARPRATGRASRHETVGPDVTLRPDWQGLDDSVDRIVRALVQAGVVAPTAPAVHV